MTYCTWNRWNSLCVVGTVGGLTPILVFSLVQAYVHAYVRGENAGDGQQLWQQDQDLECQHRSVRRDVWHKGLIVGGKRKWEKVVDGAMGKSSKKKIKLAEAATEKKLKTITVDKKPNKKKKSGKAPTAVQAAG